MSDEPLTVREFVDALIAERGGRDRFSAVQVRLCHTIAWGLRDPSKVDPSTVSRLIDLLPPRVMPPEAKSPIPEIVLVDGLSHALLTSGLGESDVAQLMGARIGELEREVVALKQAVAAAEQGVGGRPKSNCEGGGENRMGDDPVARSEVIGERPANVVPFDPRGDGSCAINTSLAERYPGIAFDRSVFDPNRS